MERLPDWSLGGGGEAGPARDDTARPPRRLPQPLQARQADPERGALADPRVDGDGPAEIRHAILDDRQPQPEAVGAKFAIALGMRPVGALEDVRQVRSGNADAVVADFHGEDVRLAVAQD